MPGGGGRSRCSSSSPPGSWRTPIPRRGPPYRGIRTLCYVRAWPAAEANAIITRRPPRAHPVETASANIGDQLLLRAWEACTAQEMRGDREAEGK
jgi:hypothetical protein